MTTVFDQIRADLTEMHTYLSDTMGHVNPDVWNMSVRAMSDTMDRHIRGADLGLPQATELGQMIQAGPWPDSC
jgi:hypothetical protein